MTSSNGLLEETYFGVILSSKLLINDLLYRIMTEKLLALAEQQPGFIDSEWVSGKTDVCIIYWQNYENVQAWLNHSMQIKSLSLGQQFWFESYSLKIFEVNSEQKFTQANRSLHASRFPSIKTPHGVLKVLEESQASLLFDYVNEERAFLKPWEPARNDAYYSMEVCELRVQEMRRDFLEENAVVLCLLSEDESRMLAYSNYSNIIRGVFCACSLGYSLRESEQGKGVITQALSAGIDYMHKQQNIDRIQANYMPRNDKSGAVLARLNFKKEGFAERYLKIDGVWEDHILTALVLR